ncbi:membrane steroid-binding protein 2-like [Oryza brachyantha]|uniref:Cytochrome b5 heme-binding domain-containing protein n=1 Tax=Oryza brachyantha TaxID=4533 RepID=J3N3V7_ORYBR|nr:membrane steroid-binding protein 2-like [Oryza brachyantha]
MATCLAAPCARPAVAVVVAAPAVRRRRAASSVHLPGRRGPGGGGVVRCSAGPVSGGISRKVAELWAAAKSASPVAVIAAVAGAALVYKVGSSLFAPPPPPARRLEEPGEVVPPAPEPVQVGEITAEELRQYDGSDPEKPLLMAINGQIYDVSQGRMFYGPGGPYALFAGKDASRALAKMSFEPQDLTDDISGLSPLELGALQDWEYKFSSKYVKVGTIKKKVPVEQGGDSVSDAIEEVATDGEDSILTAKMSNQLQYEEEMEADGYDS